MLLDEHLIEVLDRRADLVLQSEGNTFLLELHRFIEWVLGDMVLAAYASELSAEFDRLDARRVSYERRTVVLVERFLKRTASKGVLIPGLLGEAASAPTWVDEYQRPSVEFFLLAVRRRLSSELRPPDEQDGD